MKKMPGKWVGWKEWERNFDRPFHLGFPRVERTFDPTILPCEELDKLDLHKRINVCAIPIP